MAGCQLDKLGSLVRAHYRPFLQSPQKKRRRVVSVQSLADSVSADLRVPVWSPFWSLQAADLVRDCSGEGGDGVGACFGGEGVAEVGVERAPLQPAGLIDGEEAFDRALAAFGLAAEGELAIDDGGAQAAFGGVVGRLDLGDGREAPERGPELEQVVGEPARETLPLAFRAPFERAAHLPFDRFDAFLEGGAVAVFL